MTKISPSELCIQILQNCRSELYSLFPQLDGAFASLNYVPDALAEAIETDGNAIRFSPMHIIRQYGENPAAIRRGYLHMLLHCLFLHPFSSTASAHLWNLACNMAVKQIIERAKVPRLELPNNPIRKISFQIIGNTTLSAERLYRMLEEQIFPFTPTELESTFHFDNHFLWNKTDHAKGRKKWAAIGAGASRGGYRPGTASGNEKLSIQISR